MRHWPLARLALLRALEPRGLLALAVGWSLVLGCRPRLLEDVLGTSGTSPALALRHRVWCVALLLFLPLFLLRAAALFSAWRERERSWIGPRPLGTGAALLWQAAGVWLAGVLALGATALAGELAAAALAEADAPATRLVARLRHPALVLAGAREELRLPLDEALAATLENSGARARRASGTASDTASDLPADAASGAAPLDARAPSEPAFALGLRLVALPGSAAGGRARLTALAADGAHASELECAPDGDARVAVGPDVQALVLGRSAGAAFLVGRDSIELLDTRSHERAATLALALDALCAWSAWCALALALGAHLRASLALLACLALVCLPLVPLGGTRRLERFVPGAQLGSRLATLERGLVPALPAGRDWLAALTAVAGGAGLALVAARREP